MKLNYLSNTFQNVVDCMYSDIVLRVGPQICQLAFYGMAGEDRSVLSIFALVRQQNFVPE